MTFKAYFIRNLSSDPNPTFIREIETPAFLPWHKVQEYLQAAADDIRGGDSTEPQIAFWDDMLWGTGGLVAAEARLSPNDNKCTVVMLVDDSSSLVARALGQ